CCDSTELFQVAFNIHKRGFTCYACILCLDDFFVVVPHFHLHPQQQEQDPTNLYLSNLPMSVDEQELESLLKPFGHVVSTRILRDTHGVSRGVGFACVCVCVCVCVCACVCV